MKTFALILFLLCFATLSLGDNSDLTGNIQYSGVDLVYSMTIDDSDDSMYLWCQKATGVVALLKLSPSGVKLWESSFGSILNAGDQTMTPPVIDSTNGDVFVTGYASAAPGALIDASLPSALSSGWSSNYSAVRANWRGLAWSPELSLFVAVSGSAGIGSVMTSPDGMAWTLRETAVKNAWHGLVWSAERGIFVATAITGAGDRVMTSPDGINWTTRSTPADNEWYGLVWAKELGLFVAVATTGDKRAMTSPDGFNWTLQATPADAAWKSVTWSSTRNLLVSVAWAGTGNRVMTSPDGFNWTQRAASVNNSWTSVVWSAERGLFVAVAHVGTSERVMISTNGTTWSNVTIPGDSGWFSVVWAKEVSMFVAVAWYANNVNATQVMTSGDGINWTMTTPGTMTMHWVNVCWSAQLSTFVAVSNEFGNNNWLQIVMSWRVNVPSISPQWIRRTHPASTGWWDVIWADELSLFVGISRWGTGTLVMTSPDGAQWTLQNTPADNIWRSVVWSPERRLLVAVGSGGTGFRVMTSSNAFNWTLRQSAADADWTSVTWSPEVGLFAAVGRNCAAGNFTQRIMTSPDGITWTMRTTPNPVMNWKKVMWGSKPGLFVAIADAFDINCPPNFNLTLPEWSFPTPSVMTSPDGINWTLRYTPSDLWLAMAYSPELEMYAAISWAHGWNKVMWSRDGMNWTRSNATPYALNWLSITWCSKIGLFIAYSDGNYCGDHCAMASANGIDWSPMNAPPFGAAYGLAYSPKLNMVVGLSHTGALLTDMVITWQPRPSEHVFVSRFASNGTRLSTRYVTAYGNSRTAGMKLLGDNLIVAGNRRLLERAGWTGFVHAVRKSDLAEVWYSTLNSVSASNVIRSIDVDQRNGFIYVGGSVNGAAFDNNQIYAGDWDVFVARYTSAGIRTHFRQLGSSGNDQLMSLILDSRRSAVYVTGRMGGQIGSVSLMSQASDQFVAKFTPSDLSLVWLTPLGGTGLNDVGYALAVNPFNGDVYVTGEQTAAFPSISSAVQTSYYGGSSDCSFAVFSAANGALLRLVTFGSSSADTCRALAVRSDGSVGIGGRLNTTASFFAIKLASAVAPAIPLACNTSLFDYKFTEAMLSTAAGRWYAVATSADCSWTSASNQTDSVAASIACLSTCKLQSAYPDSCAVYKLNQVPLFTSVSLTQTQTATLTPSTQTVPVTQTATNSVTVLPQTLTVQQYFTATITDSLCLGSAPQTISQTITLNPAATAMNNTVTVTATLNSGGTVIGGTSNNNNSDTQNQLNLAIYTVSAGVGGLLVGAVVMFLVRKRRAVTSNNQQKPLAAAATNFSMASLLNRQAADSQLKGSSGNLGNSSGIPLSIYSMQSPADVNSGNTQWQSSGITSGDAWNSSRPQQYF